MRKPVSRNRPTKKPEKPSPAQPRLFTDPAEFRPVLLQRIRPARPRHADYLRSMETKAVTFGLGASGTGKSYIAAGFAAQCLADDSTQRLVMARPLAQCGGNNLGFLPGTLNEKVLPFMAPLLDSLGVFFSQSDIARLMELDRIRITPLELMRGSSYKNAIVLVDESQNCTRIQLEMALTRIDHGTKLIFTGDERQSDVGVSPLIELVRQLSTPSLLDSMGVVRFTRDDNMRSPIVAAIAERLGI